MARVAAGAVRTRLARLVPQASSSLSGLRSAVTRVRHKTEGANGVSPESFVWNAGSGGDDTAAIQAALDTGLPVFFGAKTYLAHGLTQSTDRQVIWGEGTRITKNANGALFTSSGNNVELRGIGFRGDAASPTYTGDGVVMAGSGARLINCGSRWMSGRALKATGDHAQVYGTCDIYQTTDATGSGYDIEIGVSGTATLYHELYGIYSSQATGGILLTDTGSHTIVGGQFGKLKIAAGTSPSGINGGKTIGARILGAVDVNVSNSILSANQFGATAITFGAGTSGCTMDQTNTYASGHTVTNNGNANNIIVRNVGAGGLLTLRYGDDASYIDVSYVGADSLRSDRSFRLPNNVNTQWDQATAAGTVGATQGMSAADNLGIVNSVSAKSIQISQAGAGKIQFITNAVERVRIDDTGLLMATAQKWIVVTGTPEGVVTAPVGSLATRTDGGAATTLYIKESGTGNTGWVAK
jgi:hypothetical protein